MAEAQKKCDFTSDQFDAEHVLENPDVAIPFEDVEELEDLDAVRSMIHSQTTSSEAKQFENIPGVSLEI